MGKKRCKSNYKRGRVLPDVNPKKGKQAAVQSQSEEEMRQQIVIIEAKIRTRIGGKGRCLSDKEIGVYLTTISNIEHKLGIKH